MAKAIADPEEIRRFAHDLKRFNDDLTHQLQERKFEEEFDHTVKAMDRFAKLAAEQIPFLLRKAQRIEDYLQQR